MKPAYAVSEAPQELTSRVVLIKHLLVSARAVMLECLMPPWLKGGACSEREAAGKNSPCWQLEGGRTDCAPCLPSGRQQ